jgi:hypothetical protein
VSEGSSARGLRRSESRAERVKGAGLRLLRHYIAAIRPANPALA